MNGTKTKHNYKWPITIGLVIGTVLIVAFAFLYKLPTHSRGTNIEDNKSSQNKDFVSVATVNKTSESPYLKTGLENVFFTVDNDSNINFYEFTKDKFNHLKTYDTLKVSLTVGKSKVHVQLNLIKKDDKTEGYGVYSDPESSTCPYLFIKLTDNQITNDEYKYLIYVDKTYSNLYSNNKNYQMAYALNPTKKSVHKLFSDKGQNVDINGVPSSSFIIIPDDFTGAKADAFYFLSDRNYEKGTMYDLYRKDGIRDSEELVCSGVCRPYLLSYKGNVYFFSVPEDDESSFNLCKYSNSGPKKVHQFSGEYSKYLVRGNYILDYGNKVLYNPFTDTEIGLSVPISVAGIQDFAVNAEGNQLAIVGNFAGNSEKLVFCKLSSSKSTGKYKIIDNTNLFISNSSNIAFADDSVYLLAPADDSTKVTNYVISWDAIFSLK